MRSWLLWFALLFAVACGGGESLPLDAGSGADATPGAERDATADAADAAREDANPGPRLLSLVPSDGVLVPGFESTTSAYELALPETTTAVAFTATVAEPEQSELSIDGQVVVSGVESPSIELPDGVTVIRIMVTGSMGGSATYTVTVRRVSAGFAQAAYLKASNPQVADGFGNTVAISGTTIVVGAPKEDGGTAGVDGDQEDNSAVAAGAVYVFVRTDGVWRQQAYLKASNTEEHDAFGSSVAIDGNTLVVGAPAEDGGASGVNGNQASNSSSESGAVYVFARTGDVWTQQAYLKASNTDPDDGFGFRVAIDGDTVVVGARGEDSGVSGDEQDDSASAAGAAYVFVRSGDTWTQQAYLKAPLADANDLFGTAVAVAGDMVAIGARSEDGSGSGVAGDPADNAGYDNGAVYIFERDGGAWSNSAYLKASNSGRSDLFAFSLALHDGLLAVGAWAEDSSATDVDGDQDNNDVSNSGAVYLFRHDGQGWGQEAYLKASNGDSNDFFGYGVDVFGDTVVVGAWGEASSGVGVDAEPQDNEASSSGAAYVFRRTDGVWHPQAYLKASNSETSDYFGYRVAVHGSAVVVGAWGEDSRSPGVGGDTSDNGAAAAGAAYLFE